MNVSYEWLRALVPFDQSPAELRDLITARVATVDELLALRGDLAPIVVARVVHSERIPETKLSFNKVDAGTGTLLDVVCGAPNVKVGALYPFAPTGTTMPSSGNKGGITIERRKIRGFTSNGMLCSARELALGADEDGIMELDLDVPTGTPILRALPIGDSRLVVDVMPNRPDLLSHLGIAREVAAAVGRPLALPPVAGHVGDLPACARARASGRTAGIDVRVDADTSCRRYIGCVVRDVTVGPSPEWLVRRLEAVGSRSINSVVDATICVLHELGQPTHAFDAAKLGGSTVVVRRARAGETITTLDGVARRLEPSMVVIADGERPQAVAGLMGGGDSEVSDATTALFLEVASFDPRGTHATRKSLGLATDASYRFERGVDPELASVALERLVRIIVAVAGGEVADAPIDLRPVDTERRTLTLRPARVARLLGDPVPAGEIATLLGGVGFELAGARDGETLRVVVPSWRGDVTDEVDLVEEVARLRGYDSFSTELRPFRPGTVPDAPQWLVARRVRDALVGAGLLETRPMPFVKGAETGFVRVTNPLAENEAYLRRELLDTLARRAEHNLAHMQGNVRLFELGAAFFPGEGGRALPREETHVAALIMGRRQPPHFTDPKTEEFERWATIDAWDARALGELVAAAAYPGAAVELRAPDAGGDALWQIVVDGAPRGSVGPVVLDAPVWASPAFGVELNLGVVDSARVAAPGQHAPAAGEPVPARARFTYRPLPTAPAAEFDLALLVPDGVTAAQVSESIRGAAGDLLERLDLVDEYVGGHVAAGQRSLAWRLTLRHPERTLGAKEIEGRRARIVKSLESDLNVRQRTS